MTHTPTPWKVIPCKKQSPLNPYKGWWIKQDDDIEFPITYVTDTIGGTNPPQEANATFIVKAVNCHEELIQALKTFIYETEEGKDGLYSNKYLTAKSRTERLNKAKQALAKAGAV